MTLEQRARSLAQYAASCCQWLHDGTPRHYTDRCEAKMLEALRGVRNQALGEAEQAIRRAPSLDENGYITEKSAAITAIQALIDTPTSEAPVVSQFDFAAEKKILRQINARLMLPCHLFGDPPPPAGVSPPGIYDLDRRARASMGAPVCVHRTLTFPGHTPLSGAGCGLLSPRVRDEVRRARFTGSGARLFGVWGGSRDTATAITQLQTR